MINLGLVTYNDDPATEKETYYYDPEDSMVAFNYTEEDGVTNIVLVFEDLKHRSFTERPVKSEYVYAITEAWAEFVRTLREGDLDDE